MDNPTITLAGITYTAPAPKVKLWREVAKFQQRFATAAKDDENALTEMERLIAATFNNPNVTPEAIDEELDLDEFIPLFFSIANWVAEVVSRKTVELPNVEAPTDQT